MLVNESWILIDEYRMLVNQSRMLVNEPDGASESVSDTH
jgi:hypothetical protein